MYEYNMVVHYDDIKTLSNGGFYEKARDLDRALKEFAVHFPEYLDEFPRDGWEPVSHSVSAIGDVLLTSVLIRRQLP